MVTFGRRFGVVVKRCQMGVKPHTNSFRHLNFCKCSKLSAPTFVFIKFRWVSWGKISAMYAIVVGSKLLQAKLRYSSGGGWGGKLTNGGAGGSGVINIFWKFTTHVHPTFNTFSFRSWETNCNTSLVRYAQRSKLRYVSSISWGNHFKSLYLISVFLSDKCVKPNKFLEIIFTVSFVTTQSWRLSEVRERRWGSTDSNKGFKSYRIFLGALNVLSKDHLVGCWEKMEINILGLL